VAVPGFDADPVLRAIAAESARAGPPAFTVDGSGEAAAPLLGWSLRAGLPHGDGDPAIGTLLSALPAAQRPVALLALAFEEDFAVIDGRDATVPWLAVCLPSRWAPEEKVGRHFAQIHAPVADNALLLEASDRLARLVSGPDRWERFVWTVSADPRLHQHPARGAVPWPAGVGAEALLAMASFRHEHQTFIPMPDEARAVFTIRIGSDRLEAALTTREHALRLHDALASMSAAVLAYRGLAGVREPLLEGLRRRADALPAAA